MADPTQPHNSPPNKQDDARAPKQIPKPLNSKLNPPQRALVIKAPKNQTFSVSPSEKARRYQEYTRLRQRPNRRCRCFCWFMALTFLLIVLLGIATGTLYLILRPKALKYSIQDINIKGMNTTWPSSEATILPKFDLTVRASNPNDKIEIFYEKDNSAEIFYNNVKLCSGVLPEFYQPSNNVTVLKTVLEGIKLGREDQKALVEVQTEELEMLLIVKLRSYVKIKVGSDKTWKMAINVDCGVTLDGLRENPEIVSSNCDKFRVNIL